MADEKAAAHYEGEILSVSASESGAVRVETWMDGEVHTRTFDREGYTTKDGEHHAPAPDTRTAEDFSAAGRAEGEVLGARVLENGDIQVQHVVDGEVRTYTHGEEAVHRDLPPPELAQDGSPIPTLIQETHAGPPGSNDVITTYRDADGDLRTLHQITEPAHYPEPPVPTQVEIRAVDELDAQVHAMAQHGIANQPIEAEFVNPPVPTVEYENHVGADGRGYELYRDQDGDMRTVRHDVEGWHRPDPPLPTAVDLDVTPGNAASGMIVEASSAHDGAHTDPGSDHHDGGAGGETHAGQNAAAPDATSQHPHAEPTYAATEEQ